MNRFTEAINRTTFKMEGVDQETLDALEESLAIDFEEHFEFQQTQARAHAMEKITTDEAQVLYAALGANHSSTNGGWAKDTDLATKIIVTQIMAELLSMRIAGKV